MFLAASHMALANLTGSPELQLRGSEARDLAVPLSKVAGLYNMTVDPRLEAYGMLMIAAVSVYGPKIIAIRERTKQTRKPGRPVQAAPAPAAPGGPDIPPVAPGEIFLPKLN